jgi:hypothetical protein
LFVNLHKKKAAIYESRGDLSEAYLCYSCALQHMKCGIFDGITSIIAESKDEDGYGPYSIRDAIGLDEVNM